MSDLNLPPTGVNRSRTALEQHQYLRRRNELLADFVRGGMTAADAGRLLGISRSRAQAVARLYEVNRPRGNPNLKGRN